MQPNHSRNFSYDQNTYDAYMAQHQNQQQQQQQGTSSTMQSYMSYDPTMSQQQYQQTNSSQPGNRYRASSPLVPQGHRYTRSNGNVPFMPPNARTPTNYAPTAANYYSTSTSQQYQSPRRPSAQRGEFVPTPSEIYSSYNQTGQGLSANATYLTSQPMGGHSSMSRGGDVAVGTTPERFPCNLCGKDFSRSHDRKRHYSTSHDTNGEKHICEYCKKTFSRGDSLKRHRDNGCDSYDGRRN